MTPVNDPRKLELMRCAYQQAVSTCFGRGQSEHCPDCQTILKKFYTGDPDGDITDKTSGIVTSECLKGPCWFGAGCKNCVPKGCPCLQVGEYCGTYVWVTASGQDELTKLTLAILDYAQNAPPTMRTKQVVYYIDEYGLPTTQKESVGNVTATINIDEKDASLLNGTTTEEARLEQIVRGQLHSVEEQLREWDKIKDQLGDRTARDARGRLLAQQEALNQKLQFISEQFRTGGLKQQYLPPAPNAPVGSLLLPFNLQQQVLTGQ